MHKCILGGPSVAAAVAVARSVFPLVPTAVSPAVSGSSGHFFYSLATDAVCVFVAFMLLKDRCCYCYFRRFLLLRISLIFLVKKRG